MIEYGEKQKAEVVPQPQISGWEALMEYEEALPTVRSKRSTLGTFRQSSVLQARGSREKREYGGTHMSVARLKAYGPSRNYVAQRTQDITG